MTYKLDRKAHPIPTKNHLIIYPFREMEVGQSFTVTDKPSKNVQAAISMANKRYAPMRWQSATVEEGCRVWRTA